MNQIICTKNAPFSFFDWQLKNISRVFAGCECVMALTADGEVLQKVTDDALAARTEYWTRIRDISVSSCIPGLALGLVADGTCMIAKRPLRRLCDGRMWDFTRVNDAVRSWNHIVQVLVTDALFSLDREGQVHCVSPDPLCRGYDEVARWRDVVRLAAGNQDSVFGITKDGRVLCAGANCLRGPHGDLRAALSSLSGVTDLSAAGSECERILLSRKDGIVTDLSGTALLSGVRREAPVFGGNFALTAVYMEDGTLSLLPYWFPDQRQLHRLENVPVSSFAAGLAEGSPFAAAVRV